MKNKIIAHLTIILIFVGVFCNVCITYNRISVFDSSVYAEADNWTSCHSSDLVTAFRYYCKSRNLALEGSASDALTSFTTSTFNNICSTLGIDPTTLQAELKKTTEGNLGLRFLFSQTGITAYNRIFAEFLQNNNLNVGDEVSNKVLYSGEYFTDDDGNGCYVYNCSNFNNGLVYANEVISKVGTPYVHNPSFYNNLHSNVGFTTHINNVEYPFFFDASSNVNYVYFYFNNSPPAYNFVIRTATNNYYDNYNVSCLCIIKIGTKYYIGMIAGISGIDTSGNSTVNMHKLVSLNDANIENGNISLTTNNTTINNNVYNNNFTIIYNDGDTYISDDDDEPLPTTPPSGGGGGGDGDNPSNPDIPPVDPTPTPPPTIPDWDIELPEMPTGNDWLLYGLEKKFPWDIPFNLMYMLSLFAADPETPHFEGTLDLKIVQWDYDIDLAPFDDIAGYVRNIEFIGFLIGLMLLTNKLIWG